MSFWKLAAAVAVGMLIAGAITWAVVEFRARAELEALTQHLDEQRRKDQAELVRISAESRARIAARRAREEAAKPRKLPRATSGAKVGSLYCMNGYTVQRVENGWLELYNKENGNRLPCRYL